MLLIKAYGPGGYDSARMDSAGPYGLGLSTDRPYDPYGYSYASANDHGRPPPHPMSSQLHYSNSADWNPGSYRTYGADQVDHISLYPLLAF